MSMPAPHWLHSLFLQPSDLSRQKRRWLSSRRRRRSRDNNATSAIERLEQRLLLTIWTDPLPADAGETLAEAKALEVTPGVSTELVGAIVNIPIQFGDGDFDKDIYSFVAAVDATIEIAVTELAVVDLMMSVDVSDDKLQLSRPVVILFNSDGEELANTSDPSDPNAQHESGFEFCRDEIVNNGLGVVDINGNPTDMGIIPSQNACSLSTITFDVVAGNTYYIGITSFSLQGYDPILDTDPSDPPPLQVEDGRYRMAISYPPRECLEGQPHDPCTLDGTHGFVLAGINTGDYSGHSVSSAGDVNGDGFDDIIIGAPGGYSTSSGMTGESYVVFGKAGGFAASLPLSSQDGTNGFVLTGIDDGDRSGFSVSGAGDVNGDGFDDLIIGANEAGDSDQGKSYVVFGKADWSGTSSLALSSLDGTNGFVLTGIDDGDRSGFSVNGAGDVNGDGFDDLILGAPDADQISDYGQGESYVVFGKSGGFAASIALSSLDGSNGFRLYHSEPAYYSGFSVSSAGDVNGDGFDDVIIGAFYAGAYPARAYSGQTFVLFGKSSGFAPATDLSKLDGSNGFRLDGISAFDRSGFSVSSAGDVNGDGFDDLLIGAPGSGDGVDIDYELYSGESYVVFGAAGEFPAVLELSSLNGTNGFRIRGIGENDSSGVSVSGAGDINGDGFDDLLIGALNADGESGESYVVFGAPGGHGGEVQLSALTGTNGFLLSGIDWYDAFGYSVSSAGDVNGDGFDDLLIGAARADQPGGTNHGESYVIFGGDFTAGAAVQVGDANANTLTATQGTAADILVGGGGDDTLISDGGDDVLRGGEGDDILAIPDANFSPRRLQGGNGTDTLRLDGAGITLDLTAIADNRITDIERIDIRGNGANTLTLDLREVLNLSTHSNTLVVRGATDDTVKIDSGWARRSDETLFGETFVVLTQGAATLKVEAAANLVQPSAGIVFQQSDGTWVVATSDGSQFTTNVWSDWGTGGVVWGDQVSGDFNGDGLQDVAARDQLTGQWTVGISDGTSFSTSIWGTWNPNKTWGQIQVADFNGDGRDDIAGRIQNAGDGRWFVSISTGSGFQFSRWVTWNPNKEWGQVSVGDFNGDGRADLIGRVQDAGDGRWFVSLSTGTKFLFQKWLTWLTHVEWGDVHIGDFNGDGLSDIASRIQEPTDGRWFLGLSTGSRFTTTVGQNFGPGQTLSHELVGDFDGDGDSEIAARLAADGRWFVLDLASGKFRFKGWGTWGTAYQWADTVVGDFNGDGRSDIADRNEVTGKWQTAISDGTRFHNRLWGTANNEDWDYIAAGEFV